MAGDAVNLCIGKLHPLFILWVQEMDKEEKDGVYTSEDNCDKV